MPDPSRVTEDSGTTEDIAEADNPPTPGTTLASILKASLLVKAHKIHRAITYHELQRLHESRANIDLEIADDKAEVQAVDAAIMQKQTDNLADILASGLSIDLLKAYYAFCESLYPDGYTSDGFSILCDQRHRGSYFDYDPSFSIFRKLVKEEYAARERSRKKIFGEEIEVDEVMEEGSEGEDDDEVEEIIGESFMEEMVVQEHWTRRNFRCEVSASISPQLNGSQKAEQIVAFWPITCIEPEDGDEVTWGERYVSFLALWKK
jgi:hypothetical protein